MNGRSTTRSICCTGAMLSCMITAVAAAASVPFSSTARMLYGRLLQCKAASSIHARKVRQIWIEGFGHSIWDNLSLSWNSDSKLNFGRVSITGSAPMQTDRLHSSAVNSDSKPRIFRHPERGLPWTHHRDVRHFHRLETFPA